MKCLYIVSFILFCQIFIGCVNKKHLDDTEKTNECVNIFEKKSKDLVTDTLEKDSVTVSTIDTTKTNTIFGVKVNLSDTSILNDIAKYIAGIKPNKNSKIFKLINNDIWMQYSANSDSVWDVINHKNILKMDKWRDNELNDINKQIKTVFYPFSGPDFLFVNKFFPNAEKYYMFALENIGELPDIGKFNKYKLELYLSEINYSMRDITKSTFFITKNMINDLNKPEVGGVLPIIMVFMARTNNNILSIKPVKINSEGEIEYLKSYINYKGKNRYGKGFEICFCKDNPNIKHYLYYFPYDLSNNGFKYYPELSKFISKLDSLTVTYIKSASYLMHNKDFTEIKKHILQKTLFLVQDDSGIPYSDFDKSKWNITLYGKYIKPISDFSWCMQKNLKDAYEKESKPMPFKIGYGYISNLQVARRLK